MASLAYDIPVRGHSVFTATPSSLNSSAIPRAHKDIPYFAIVYAVTNYRGKHTDIALLYATTVPIINLLTNIAVQNGFVSSYYHGPYNEPQKIPGCNT